MFVLEPMTEEDIGEVSRVERRCFSNPWPASAYRRELRNPSHSYYVVMREQSDAPQAASSSDDRGTGVPGNGLHRRPRSRFSLLPFGRRDDDTEGPGRIVGFAGMWNLFDEAHITTIGVDPEYRGRNFGEVLLLDVIAEALNRGASMLSLEVRVSNEIAQGLYDKYGFHVHGVRRGYYTDNREDAYVMWSPSLRDPAYLEQLRELRHNLHDQVGAVVRLPDEDVFTVTGVASQESRSS